MKVHAPKGEETFDDIHTTELHLVGVLNPDFFLACGMGKNRSPKRD